MGQAAKQLERLQQATERELRRGEQFTAAATAAGTQAGQQQDTPRIPKDKDGQASFATPEAIATGVVGSILLGPVGGILLGAAQGWLGQRERQNVLDEQASRNEAIAGSTNVLADQIAVVRSNALTPQAVDEADFLDARLNKAIEDVKTGDPILTERAGGEIASINEELKNITRIQADIANNDRVTQQQIERENGIAARAVYDDAYDEFRSDISPMMQQNTLIDRTLRLVESGSDSDLFQAVTSFTKSGDPTSIVTGGERLAATEIDPSLLGQLRSFEAKYKDGQVYTQKDRQDIARTMLLFREQNDSEFQKIQARSIDKAQDVGIRPELLDNFDPEFWMGERYTPAPEFFGAGPSVSAPENEPRAEAPETGTLAEPFASPVRDQALEALRANATGRNSGRAARSNRGINN